MFIRSHLFLLAISTIITCATGEWLLEAEDATFVGASISSWHEGWTGSGFVDFQTSDAYIEFQFNVQSDQEGDYQMKVRFAAGYGGNGRPCNWILDGTEMGDIGFLGEVIGISSSTQHQ